MSAAVPPKVHHFECASRIIDHLGDCPVPRVRCVARTRRGRCEADARLRSDWCPEHWQMRRQREEHETAQQLAAIMADRR